MDKILNKLYYDDKLGVAGKANFIKKVRVLHPEFKVKDINEWLNNQSVSQINTTINKKYIIHLQNHFKKLKMQKVKLMNINKESIELKKEMVLKQFYHLNK